MTKSKNLTEYQPDDFYADEYDAFDEYDTKRKRLAVPEYYQLPTHTPQRHPFVEAIAWIVMGSMGLALTVGSVIAVTHEPVGDEWVMLVPLAYTAILAYWMRRR